MTDSAPPSEESPRRRRRGERAAASAPAHKLPQPRFRFPPVALVSADELESIHQASLTVLKEIGIDFLHEKAKALLRDIGADVDPASDRVRFDPALVEAHIGLAPRQFTLHSRNPERALVIGGDYTAFCSVASAPNSFDRDGGRRPGNHHDFQNFIRLG